MKRNHLFTRLHQLESVINQHSDCDSEWWPFLALRPEPKQLLSYAKCWLIAFAYTLPAVGVALVWSFALGQQIRPLDLFLLMLAVGLLVFAVLRITVAYCWNRRAERLRRSLARRSEWLDRALP